MEMSTENAGILKRLNWAGYTSNGDSIEKESLAIFTNLLIQNCS